MKHLPIRWKITAMAFGIVAFTLLIIGIILLGYVIDAKEEELSQQAMITAQLVAQNQTVQETLTQDQSSARLQQLVERIRIINKHDYIVIINMERLRLTHPIPERIGTYFASGDGDAAFVEHIYVSKAQVDGTKTVRAFVPIMREREQIGVVLVGSALPTIVELILEFRQTTIIILIITSLFGMWGAWLLASHIKKQTFQMEPDELARVLVERTATFHAIHDGIIAIDENERITVINEAARDMLRVQGEAIGRPIFEVIPDSRLPEILTIGKPLYRREFYVQNRAILSNRIPIVISGKTVGAVATFQDKTEVNRLAEELTGVQSFVDALRLQNHEFSNKLHTIAGLIQLNQGKKALDYIFELSEEQTNLSRFFMEQIHDDSISGLLLGKLSRGKELGISLIMNQNSSFMNYPEGMTNHDLVVIIGNLIDNAFDALLAAAHKRKEVFVSLVENDQELVISVKDNGEGLAKSVEDKMFTRGFSTKAAKGRGIGLFLISAIIERLAGEIKVQSSGEGTLFTIIIPMKRGGDHVE